MFFELSGIVYCNGESVQIEDIGEDVRDRNFPGAALICNTSNVNKNCCRNIDNHGNGSMGIWYDPSNNKINKHSDNQTVRNVFVQINYEKQVRLVKRGAPEGPLGIYRCEVPATNGDIESAAINIVSGQYTILY